MNEVYYEIANIVIKVLSPFSFYANNAENFRCEPKEPDYTFRFEQTNDIPNHMKDAAFIADVRWAHEFQKKDGSYQRAFLWEQYYVAVSEIYDTEGVCYYASANILLDKAKEGFELWMYLCVEEILLKFQALVLHSSHINYQGKGLVFSAPSQTGKSTQAELWKKYAGAEVLNGDRSILRKQGGSWQVYGCPMCGTSNIHLQGQEILSNIVMLSQNPVNVLQKIGGMRAFRLIYPQITVPVWNQKNTNQVMNLISDLIEEVPVWYYACTKEADAVMVLQQGLGL